MGALRPGALNEARKILADEDREQLIQFRLLDREGRLARWPSKAPQRQLALCCMAGRFSPERSYPESEVNDILKACHAFGDWALPRRELVDRRYLGRDDAGRGYRLAAIDDRAD